MNRIDKLIEEAAEQAINEMCGTGELKDRWSIVSRTHKIRDARHPIYDCTVTFESGPESNLIPIKFKLVTGGGDHEQAVRLNAEEITRRIRLHLHK